MEAANYGILSLIPLALTLLLAFWKKDAVFALFMGCLSGVLLLGHDPAFGFSALAKEALGNEDFIWILLIQVFIGIMIAFFMKAGVVKAFAEMIAGKVKSPRSVKLATWFIGQLPLVIGFGDIPAFFLVLPQETFHLGGEVDISVPGAGLGFLDEYLIAGKGRGG